MRKTLLLLTGAVIVTAFTTRVCGDMYSDAYKAAVETGDYPAAYRAQSFLTPPYCYDLNLWHGVKFIKAVNGHVVKPTYPFMYQDMTHLKVRELYVRAGIKEMEKVSHTEFELIQHICNWANMHWGHMQPLPYPSWDAHEILDRVEKGDAFWCTFKADLFVQACSAAGLTARMMGINRQDADAHTVTEVYSNEFRKWMLVDPWLNCYVERDGVPLSAREFHNSMENPAGIYLVFGENGRGTEYWDFKTGKAQTIPHAHARIPIEEDSSRGLINHYHDVRIVLRNDHTVHPQSKENVYIDGFMVPYNARGGEWWGPQLHWIDDKTPPQITCDNTGEINDFEWPLNEVKVDFMKVSIPGEPLVIETKFSTLTPNFSHFLLTIDDKPIPIDDNVFRWRLRKGTNSMKVASFNDVGRSGFPSEFVIQYDPDSIDYTAPVTVELKNPGMEEENKKSRGNIHTPAYWGTVTSNALQFKEFSLDSSVKHSGRYALKVTPAQDVETGIEYAFIIRSDNFKVNPGTDVIYSIWLRASQDNVPVDIALLESTYKGLGTYVERIVVGKKWEKYELKCRLHNEITQIYVGFKVYSGTVWADDANFVEVNK